MTTGMQKTVDSVKAALELKHELFGERNDLGHIGTGADDTIHVYVNASRKRWKGQRYKEWTWENHTYKVMWHFDMAMRPL